MSIACNCKARLNRNTSECFPVPDSSSQQIELSLLNHFWVSTFPSIDCFFEFILLSYNTTLLQSPHILSSCSPFPFPQVPFSPFPDPFLLPFSSENSRPPSVISTEDGITWCNVTGHKFSYQDNLVEEKKIPQADQRVRDSCNTIVRSPTETPR